MAKQLSATVSPISGYKTSLDDTIQCAALRPRMNILMHWPSWSWMTMATITENDLISRSCAMMDRQFPELICHFAVLELVGINQVSTYDRLFTRRVNVV